MPRFDHTGPEGNGSRTGRGMGKCGKAANAAGRGMVCSRFTARWDYLPQGRPAG